MQGTPWRRYGRNIVLALVLLSCAGGESDLTGMWTGTLLDSMAGVGALRLTMAQTAAQLQGTWQSTFPDPTLNNGGALSGTVAETAIALVFVTSQPQACSFTVAVTRDDRDADHVTGTYVTFNCARPTSGSLEVTRH